MGTGSPPSSPTHLPGWCPASWPVWTCDIGNTPGSRIGPKAKATGLRNLPCRSFDANAAWLQIVMTATDLVAWSKLIGFADQPALARCEIQTFRYRVLHVAARISRGARKTRLRIEDSWPWAQAMAPAWEKAPPRAICMLFLRPSLRRVTCFTTFGTCSARRSG